jgi:exodeoxyribonuclease VII large subunit
MPESLQPETLKPEPGHNRPDFSVAELSRAVKGVLEDTFERVRVRGEAVGVRRYPSGHVYFDLKDSTGGTEKIKTVVWKSAMKNLAVLPKDGDEVIVTGRVSAYGDRSEYQLTASFIEYAGEGALLARIARLKAALEKEGLFDAARKRPIPRLPGVIGVVTSPTGAVIRDILHRLAARFPRHVLLWPTAVQGPGAAEGIAAAIRGFNAIVPGGAVPRPDLIIVARGGGSLEDLMAFNEEIVVRAVAASMIPLISAVGHETDTTLIDFAADLRAPTPTGAAEMAVPVRAELVEQVKALDALLTSRFRAGLSTRRLRLERAANQLPDLRALVGSSRQQLDDRSGRLARALPAWVAARRGAVAQLAQRLRDPRARIATARGALALLAQRLEAQSRRTPERAREKLSGLAARLEAVSYTATLARGFALVTNAEGQPLTKAAQVKPGAALRLTFHDGTAEATGGTPPRQGSLL